MRTPEEALDDIFNGFSSQTLVEKPCIISKVIDNYTVDVTYYDNNKPYTLVNVPVKHLQTNSAFIFLKLKAGDCGTVRFFDNDVTAYYNGSDVESDEQRTHDLNDNEFTYGFYPSAKHYVFPDGDIVIGTQGETVATIKMTGGTLVIEAVTATITASTVTLGAKTTIDGIPFLLHKHYDTTDTTTATGKVVIP